MSKQRPPTETTESPSDHSEPAREVASLVRRHLRFGWWSLALFLTLGIVLEAMHGYKVVWYLGADNVTRRLMFTLAHAHGTLLSLVHLAFAATLPAMSATGRLRSLASPCLCGAGVTLPAGFLLGGIFLYARDPGLGIMLVPLGALLLLVAVITCATSIRG